MKLALLIFHTPAGEERKLTACGFHRAALAEWEWAMTQQGREVVIGSTYGDCPVPITEDEHHEEYTAE